MAACDIFRCKFFSVTPCFTEGAGQFGIFFCFASKPRCRFCSKLYEQQLLFPWHWVRSGRKTDYITSAEAFLMGGLAMVIIKLSSFLSIFIFLGSAYFRRDLNQAFKGCVNFMLCSVGISSFFFLGPLCIIIFAFMLLTDPVIDWFFCGRCNDCWEYACTGCCCCLGGSLKEGEEPKLPPKGSDKAKAVEAAVAKKKRVQEYQAKGGPPQEQMEALTEQEQLLADAGEQAGAAGEGSGAAGAAKGGMCCCVCCLLILAAIGFALYPAIMAGIEKATDLVEQGKNATAGVDLGQVVSNASKAATKSLNHKRRLFVV